MDDSEALSIAYIRGVADMKKEYESRTCSNCKHMCCGIGHMDDMSYCNAEDNPCMECWQNTEEMNTFCCNKWMEQR